MVYKTKKISVTDADQKFLLACNPALPRAPAHSAQPRTTPKTRSSSPTGSPQTRKCGLSMHSQNECTTEVSARDALARHTRMRSRSRALGVHSTYDGCCPRLVSQSSLMEFAMSRVLWRTCEERPSRASVHEMHEWIVSNDTFPWTQLCLQQPRHAAHTNGRARRPCSKCRANGCGGCAPRSAQGVAAAEPLKRF